MIFGIGIDLIEVERIENKISSKDGFAALVFSQNEIEYCETKANKYEHYAARFAAKEAFLKALGTGWKSGTNFNEIEIVNNAEGKPCISFSGITAQTVANFNFSNIFVSLTHLKLMAAAVVTIEI